MIAGSRLASTVQIHDACGREESRTGRDEARQIERHAEPRGDGPVASGNQNRRHEDDQKSSIHFLHPARPEDANAPYGQ